MGIPFHSLATGYETLKHHLHLKVVGFLPIPLASRRYLQHMKAKGIHSRSFVLSRAGNALVSWVLIALLRNKVMRTLEVHRRRGKASTSNSIQYPSFLFLSRDWCLEESTQDGMHTSLVSGCLSGTCMTERSGNEW